MLLHDPSNLGHIVVENFLRRQIDLGEHNEKRQLQSARNTKMLLRHLRNSSVGGNNQQAVVGEQRRQAVHRRLQVLLVTAHVEQVYDLSGVFDDIRPYFVTFIRVSHLCHILVAVLVKADDLVRDAGRAAIAPLVLESEHPLSQQAVAIVERAWCTGQHSR